MQQNLMVGYKPVFPLFPFSLLSICLESQEFTGATVTVIIRYNGKSFSPQIVKHILLTFFGFLL